MTWYNACTEGWAGRRLYGDRTTCEDGHSSSWRTDSSQLCCKELPPEPKPTPSPNNTIPATLSAQSGTKKENDNILIIVGIVFLFFLISALD